MNPPKYPQQGDDIIRHAQAMWKYVKHITPRGPNVTRTVNGTTLHHDRRQTYSGPFRLRFETGYTGRIYCDQGWIVNGTSIFNFPDDNPAGVNEYVALAGTNTHYIFFDMNVDDETGAIDKTDATEIPLLLSTTVAWSTIGALGNNILIGEVDTVAGVITEIRQRWQGTDIYMPVMGQVDTAGTPYYFPGWLIWYTAESALMFDIP